MRHTLTTWLRNATLLGIHPSEKKVYVHTKTYTQMLTAALFITA